MATGRFRPSHQPSNVGPVSATWRSGDFNGDGKLDLVGLAPASACTAIDLYLGNGDGTFQPGVSIAAGNRLQSIGVGDFNGDGKSDVVVTDLGVGPSGTLGGGENHGAGSSSSGVPPSLNLLLGNGDGTFQAPIVDITDESLSIAAVGDFNGDGKPDLALLDDAVNLGLGGGCSHPFEYRATASTRPTAFSLPFLTTSVCRASSIAWRRATSTVTAAWTSP